MPENEPNSGQQAVEAAAPEAPNKTVKERLKEITDSIETGIRELFKSDRYRSYLSVMSRFHNYSVNNTMLIYLQKPDATLVAGFNKWKDQFGRHVKKGEKGIQIIAPTPYLKKTQEPVLDPDTKAPMLDADGNEVMEERTIKIPVFKPVSVFDVSQTEGRPLPQLAATLTGDVQQYEAFLEALRRSSSVPIEFEKLQAGTDGYFSPDQQRIAIREGMSEVQTVSAVIHEMAHSKLHNYQELTATALENGAEAPVKKDRRTEEVEAESVSYSICQYYGIETAENSFGYIASWSQGKELKELRASLETINRAASGLITDIDRNFAEVCKERGITQEKETKLPEANKELGDPEVLLLLDSKQYLHVQREGDHYNYALYDRPSRKLMESGHFPRESTLCHTGQTEMGNAIREVYVREALEPGRETLVPLEWLDSILGKNEKTAEQHVETVTGKPEPAKAPEPEKTPEPAPAKQDEPQELPVRTPIEQLPDPVIHPRALELYGYTDESMLPLSKDRALELLILDVPVFLIYQNGAESMACEPEEILSHNGLFGVTKEDWAAACASIPPRDVEQRFADNQKDAFVIYQLKPTERDRMFVNFDDLDSPPVREQYEPVYIGELPQGANTGQKLESLYQTFNLERPADFTGHSMSVSDLVVVKQAGVVSAHFCDAAGFVPAPDFKLPENYMRNAEMAMEDDYGMIDGIINNGPKQPTVAELEAQAKAGEPISLYDLAMAVKAEKQAAPERKEKKPSILEQLKTPRPQETPKKPAPRRSIGAEMEV